ncbi:MAG: cation diffusion facilitator family transporter [Sporolactobacillus sp.]
MHDESKAIHVHSVHGHDHSHHHGANANRGALQLSFFLITAFMIVEFIGGLMTGSLTLLGDSGHMLSDSVSLGLSFAAVVVGAKIQANSSKTFGYRRFEILAALFNGVLLLLISVAVVVGALLRFGHPAHVAGNDMLVIATVGLVVNVTVALILMRGEHKENLNIRSALLHVIGDLLGSIGAIVAALLITWFGFEWADPMASIIVSLMIMHSGWQVTGESISILMEARPRDIDLEEIRSELLALPGVAALHDLHIWTITSGFFSISCHIIVNEGADRDQLLTKAEALLNAHHLGHATIQMEGVHFTGCTSDCTHERKLVLH